MGRAIAGAISTRLWFAVLIAASAALLLVTIASYALVDHPSVALPLFWLGFGGENNIGAWWSGMLLALAAFLVFDGFFDPAKSSAEQRGWLALGFAVLLLSFDEIASLHEYLSSLGLKYLAALGVVGLSLASYGLQQLHKARVPARILRRLLLAFGLLASVPIQELIQHTLQWDDQLIYGLRAFVEEGTEIVAMLIFVSVGREISLSLLGGSQDCLVALVRRWRLVALAALLLWPALTAATLVLQRTSGPIDWLASTLFLACGLLAVRGAVLRDGLDWSSLTLTLLYVAASAAANAISFEWNPVVFGAAVNLRGIVFALLLASGIAILKSNGRPLKPSRAFPAAAAIVAAAVAWPSSQVLWCGLPPVLAIWLYRIESKKAEQSKKIPLSADVLQIAIKS
jgi:hypothetical protein